MNYSNLVIFDLDGVLVKTKEIHFDALNEALLEIAGEDYVISKAEHLAKYDGRSTKTKLEMLYLQKGLPRDLFASIESLKKIYTADMLDEEIGHNPKLIGLFNWLKTNGYKIAVASNAIRQTVVTCLTNLGLIKLTDYFLSNEDVTFKKPHPEIYWKCMVACGADVSTTLIIEDSAIGREGAKKTGARTMFVNGPEDLSVDSVNEHLNVKTTVPTWDDSNMTVVIPMAGAGSRFADAGYTFPKPLIEVRGKPMIQVVVENLGIKAKYVFIVQRAHYEKYNLKQFLNLIAPGCEIVQIDGLTNGAACTTLLAKEFINNDRRLVIANSDQFVEWNPNDTIYSLMESGADAGILTFKSTHPKWSFARLDEDGFVSEVAEKNPISDNATVGIYYWAKGSDYVKYAEQMIEKNIRVNNEFYVCPVFNEAIGDNKKIVTREVSRMWGIGTPEDLNYFNSNYKGDV